MTAPDDVASMTGVTAYEDAEAAARRAGVTVRALNRLSELEAVFRLYDTIWRPEPSNPPITVDILRALAKAGNYVVGAYEGERLVGASTAFFGPPGSGLLHSHVAGVSPTTRGVGFALKLHQRAWALQHGLLEIEWTFDPLVGRNAYFNLAKLGGTAAEYLPNFYGAMLDAVNGSDDSDRLLLRWHLADPGVVAACAGRPEPCSAEGELAAGAVLGLARDEHGGPVSGTLDGTTVLIAVPPDIERLRSANPGAAKEWRVAVRERLGGLMAAGAAVRGFDRAGWYVVTRKVDR
jgi:predicted GNAT superfamily acetyltransferase